MYNKSITFNNSANSVFTLSKEGNITTFTITPKVDFSYNTSIEIPNLCKNDFKAISNLFSELANTLE